MKTPDGTAENLRARLAETAHRLTIVDPHERIVTELDSSLHPEPRHDDFKHVGRKISALTKLICAIPSRFYAGDVQSFGSACGFTKQALETLLLFQEPLRSDVFTRGDLIKNDNGWKLLEINAGSTVGGMFYASLTRLAGFEQKYDVLKSWAQLTSERWNVDGPIALVEDDRNLSYMKLSLHVLAEELAQVSGQQTFIVGQSELSWDGKTLQTGGQQVKFICNLFNEQDVVRSPESYAAITNALRANHAKMLMGPFYRMIANKGALALLYELADANRLSAEEAQILRELVPKTIFATVLGLKELIENRRDWVLKPVDGFAGQGIYCGNDLSDVDWKKSVEHAVSASPARAYVAQEFVVPGSGTTQMTTKQGESTEEVSNLLWGVFVFGDQYLGSFIRARPAESTTTIINHATGASVGPVPEVF